MNEVIKILMQRDNLSYDEAANIFDDVRDEVLDAALHGKWEECERIVASELGLEPDYLDEFVL